MRIKEISVKKLFGIFNHIVPLNIDERITIIHGQNGSGKTTLLKLVNSIFNYRYSEVFQVPFKELRIDFNDNSYMVVNKDTKNGSEDNDLQINLTFTNSQGKTEEPYLFNNKFDINDVDFPISIIDDLIPELERISPTKWLYIPTNEKLSLPDVFERFENYLPTVDLKVNKQPYWLENFKKNIHIRFIESQRLFNLYDNSKPRVFPKRISMVPSVAAYANELASNIQIKLTEYGALSQSLDRTFPVRVVQQKSSVEFTDEELRSQLNKLEEKRHHLINIGLLDQDENQNFQVEEQIDKSTKKLLSVYIEDVNSKLKLFDELAERIELFKRIINQRFSYKEINISRDKGFTFTSQGHSLSPTKLSSGEQHELVILYELLFKVQPNSLILIDEPELSLHVEWQVNFIKDLQSITKISEVDVLMATHSPDLINDRWDLTVELKGPKE